jgi:hypothetical protein
VLPLPDRNVGDPAIAGLRFCAGQSINLDVLQLEGLVEEGCCGT